jgi:hypothetical protein
MHTIESSNLDADFSPGEKTTNAPAELDEIYATSALPTPRIAG